MAKTSQLATDNTWVLNPSDFAFLWEECKRCFYLKVREGFRRPGMPMPKIFSVIDEEMKKFYAGVRTEKRMPFLAPGTVDSSVSWVQSKPLEVPRHATKCVLRGKIDTLVRFDDASSAVIDFKTSARKEGHIELYARQLHAYATALEQAAAGHVQVSPVKILGLLVYEPNQFAQVSLAEGSLHGGLHWISVPRDDKKFFAFLGGILEVLENPNPPEIGACAWCQYREASRRTGL